MIAMQTSQEVIQVKRLTVDERAVRVGMAASGIRNLNDLADRAGLGVATLWNVMRGDAFRSTTIDAIAQAIGGEPLDYITVIENGHEAAQQEPA